VREGGQEEEKGRERGREMSRTSFYIEKTEEKLEVRRRGKRKKYR
jgi:hypothetical protein